MEPIIRTERLTLRPFREEDAPQLRAIATQDSTLRWMPDWGRTEEGMRELIRRFRRCYPLATRESARVALAVEHGGRLIGMVGIGNKKEVDNEIEIAYFLDGDAMGQGFATEAAGALSRWALETLGVDYLIAIVEPENRRSRRVLEKCGFRYVEDRRIVNAGETQEKRFRYLRLYARPPAE